MTPLLSITAVAELQAKAAPYFEHYPPSSFMYGASRPTLFALIRLLRPREVAEVGTLFAGTAELIARALWENGGGILHSRTPMAPTAARASSPNGPTSFRRLPATTR
jgi:hypothetical protein